MSPLRRRNSVLQTVELLRGLDPAINMSQVRAFLYVCENEGLSVSELSELLTMTRATGSRVIRSIAADDQGGTAAQLGLVEVTPSERGDPLKAIRLTPAGQSLKTRIDAIIARADPIAVTGPLSPMAGTSL